MRRARSLPFLLLLFCCAASGVEQPTTVELFIVCKEVRTRQCFAKRIQTGDEAELAVEVKSLPPEMKAVCGISDLKPISPHRRFVKVQSPKRKHATFCKTTKISVGQQLPWNDIEEKRVKRDAYAPRGRYRGQTQSQYLSINGDAAGDDGKAEAHSSADVSRAIVSGKSGMGQAQSQTTYDSNCDDCYGRAEPGSEYLYREYIPYIPQIQGQTPGNGVTGTNYGSHRPGVQKPGGTYYPYNPNQQSGGRIPESDTSSYGRQSPSRPQEPVNVGATVNGDFSQIPSSGTGNGAYNTRMQPNGRGPTVNNYGPSGSNVGATNVHTQPPTGQDVPSGYMPRSKVPGGSDTDNLDTRRPDIIGTGSNGYNMGGIPVTGGFGTQRTGGNGLLTNNYGSQGTNGDGTGPHNYGSGEPRTGGDVGTLPQNPAGETRFDTYRPDGGTGPFGTPTSTGGGTRPSGNGITSGSVGIQRPGENRIGIGSPDMRPSSFGTKQPNVGGIGYDGNVMTPNDFNTHQPTGNGLRLGGNGMVTSSFGPQGPVTTQNIGTPSYVSSPNGRERTGSIPQTGIGSVSNPETSYQQPNGGTSQTPYNPQLSGSPVSSPSSGLWPFIGPYTWNQHGQTYFCCVVGPNGLSVPTLGDPRINGLGYNQSPLNTPSHTISNGNRINNEMGIPNPENKPINTQTPDSQYYDRNQGYMSGTFPTNHNSIPPTVQNTIPMRTTSNFPISNIANVPNGPSTNWNNGQNTNRAPDRFPVSTNTQNGSGGNYDMNNPNTNGGQDHFPRVNIPNTQNSGHGTWPTNVQNANDGQNVFPGTNVLNTPKSPDGIWNTNGQNANGDQNNLNRPKNYNTQNSSNGPWNGQNQNIGQDSYPQTNIPNSQNPNMPWTTKGQVPNGVQNGNNIGQNLPNGPNNNVANTPDSRLPHYNWNMPDGQNNNPNGGYVSGQTESNIRGQPSYNPDQMNVGSFRGVGDGGQTMNREFDVNRNGGSGNGGFNYNGSQGGQGNRMPEQNGGYGAPPLNVIDPNSISTTLENGDSQASASVDQGPNGTLAQASSDGGIGKGRAKTSVEGQYTGSGTFSAQAQISDETKSAESEVSGGKHGALSSALGRGGKSKSQASVQLGSETGSISTNAHSDGSLHSSLTQVQGSVKGGMADAQAKGPGSTSSQAQIGFTPYKEGDEGHKNQKTPFAGGGKSLAQSNGRLGQSESQLHGTFKYGITYTGGAQAGSSVDKDAVFSKRLPFNEIDVFDESEKNIDVENETSTEQTSSTEPALTTEVNTFNDNVELKGETHNHKLGENQSNLTHFDDHKTETLQPTGDRRSFEGVHDDGVEYEDTTIKGETVAEDYDSGAGYGEEGTEVDVGDGEYTNYEEYQRESDSTHQSLQNPKKMSSSIEVKQTTGGNTQHILLGPLRGQNAEITQTNSEQKPDESKIYQPGERVPGTGGYTIPIGFTGSVKSVASKQKTYAIGSKDSPSQAQTVAITPGAGRIKYNNYAKPRNTYTRNVHPKDLRSLYSPKQEDSRYVTVSKSVTGALDGDNNIKKQYSHTYYTKSSSCGYFTFTCTIVSGTNGRTKICKPKIPLNPDGTPMKC